MIVVPFKAEHLLALQIQDGQAHDSVFITPGYAKQLEGQYAFTALIEDQPICVAGVAPLWENRALAWSFIDHRAGPHFIEVHRAVKKILDALPYRRIEADAACEFPAAHRWLKMLGFKLEAERMRAYRPDGGDSSLYARVK